MLYERFWHWLTRYDRRHCEHDYAKVGTSNEMINYNIYYYNHFKCNDCGKIKKSIDFDKTKLSNNHTYF